MERKFPEEKCVIEFLYPRNQYGDTMFIKLLPQRASDFVFLVKTVPRLSGTEDNSNIYGMPRSSY